MDGQKQRQALGAAEQALRALIAGDAGKARKSVERAVELDQVGAFTALAPIVGAATGDLESTGAIPVERWRAITEALDAGPLAALAMEQLRDD